ncbi:MAG TPA: Ig-like domain-containing protein [Thermoanaerobaculia bacterium]|nr:Ig-like domain-containing protein [Thermoanaerobaculia bacterium]
MQIDQDTVIVSGDLVVNDVATTPILGELQLSLDRRVQTAGGWNVIADRIDLDRDVSVGGDVFFNVLRNDGTIAGAMHTPLALPVFAVLPSVNSSAPGTDFVGVHDGETVDVPEGTYSLLTVGVGGVARLTGSGYAFSSIAVAAGGSVVCTGACTISVAETIRVDAAGTFAGADAGAMRVQAGTNVTFGRDTTVAANVYAPNGTMTFGRDAEAEGAFLAHDIHVGRGSRFTLDSAFDAPPTADAQTVFTNGTASVTITLTGSDPEGHALTFAIVTQPQFGTLSPLVQNVVTYTPSGDGNVEDAFTFSVTDAVGSVGTAVVSINPPREEPPPPPAATVVADDLAATITQEMPETLVLTAKAPDGVALSFSIVANSGPFHGTLGALSGADVVYTPDDGYNGPDSFQFEACGVVSGDTVCDTATFALTVIPLRIELPNLANDIETTTFADRPRLISLGLTSVETLRTTRIRTNAAFLDSVEVAGTVADSNTDGVGDNHMVLPASVPVFMSAGVGMAGGPGSNGTVRMHFEWDISNFGGSAGMLRSATMRLNTHRGSIDSLPTIFYFIPVQGDGALTDADFAGPAERVRGGVMEVPEGMPVGSDGTFEISVLGELSAAINNGLSYFVVQGRVVESTPGPARGLEVRTSCELNRNDLLEPMLSITTPGVTIPLQYTVDSLPLNGALFDGQTAIAAVPYVLSGSNVTFTPAQGFLGQTSFGFSVSDGVAFDSALVTIHVILSNCANDPSACDDGR